MKPIEQDAILCWRLNSNDRANNYIEMGEGYFKASELLLNSLIDDNSRYDADVVIFPIFFSIHHGIELYLKGIFICTSQLNDETNQWNVEVKKTHSIDTLIEVLNKNLESLNCTEKLQQDKLTSPLFDVIALCKDVGDDQSGSYYVDFARYPESLSRKGTTSNQHVFVYENNSIHINLKELLCVTKKCSEFLDGYAAKFSHWLEEQENNAQKE